MRTSIFSQRQSRGTHACAQQARQEKKRESFCLTTRYSQVALSLSVASEVLEAPLMSDVHLNEKRDKNYSSDTKQLQPERYQYSPMSSDYYSSNSTVLVV